MKLYYEDSYKDTLEYVQDCKDVDEAIKAISAYWNPIFQEQLGYKVPYIRINGTPEYYWFDFGSYSKFYRLYKEGFKPTEKEIK